MEDFALRELLLLLVEPTEACPPKEPGSREKSSSSPLSVRKLGPRGNLHRGKNSLKHSSSLGTKRRGTGFLAPYNKEYPKGIPAFTGNNSDIRGDSKLALLEELEMYQLRCYKTGAEKVTTFLRVMVQTRKIKIAVPSLPLSHLSPEVCNACFEG